MSRLTTTPPADGVPVALYDGHCRICTAGAERLARMSRGRVAPRSFHEDGVLAAFPGLTHEDCMKELKVVDARGRVFGGAEAIVRSFELARPILGKLALAYYVPGLRWAADHLYARAARRRYQLGKTGECDGDACAVHFR